MAGFSRSHAPGLLVLTLLAAAVAWMLWPAGPAAAAVDSCTSGSGANEAYVIRAYEASADRSEYLDAMTLAGWDQLFPGDPNFASPALETGARNSQGLRSPPYIPPVIIKAVSYIESNVTQADTSVPFQSIGPVLLSNDCGYGLMQITSGMHRSGSVPTDVQALTGTHYLYNIGRGAWFLGDKWNLAPNSIPLVCTDLDSSRTCGGGGEVFANPAQPEHWYFALWAYNSFSDRNHPKTYDPLRPAYQCGSNRTKNPYQELVFGCATHPPALAGAARWTAVPINRPLDAQIKPDITSRFAGGGMTPADDIAVPPGSWGDPTTSPGSARRNQLLGAPALSVDQTSVSFQKLGTSGPAPVTVTLSNPGTGVAAWKAEPSQSWIRVNVEAGVAAGSGVPISFGSRNAAVTISIADPGLPPGTHTGAVTFRNLVTGTAVTVNVAYVSGYRAYGPGVAR